MNVAFKHRHSFLAGAFAAGGSFFGKLPGYLNSRPAQEKQFDGTHYYLEFLLHQVLPLALMVSCNLLNWRYFLRALQAVEQTLMATVLTAATNYIISFLLGFAFYREPFSLLSVSGSALIILGLWFLCDAEVKNQTKECKKS